MFQFIRRVSGSLLPRPDRPWRDDATSHAPTIGRKRRYSVTERDNGDSVSFIAKKTRHAPEESPKGDVAPPVETQEVKEVTKGVQEVDLEDKHKVDDASPIRPEGVPLPDSPSGSPEPEVPNSAKSGTTEETKDEEHADDGDSVASSAPEDEVPDAEFNVANTDAFADETTPAQVLTLATVESDLYDTSGTLEVDA